MTTDKGHRLVKRILAFSFVVLGGCSGHSQPTPVQPAATGAAVTKEAGVGEGVVPDSLGGSPLTDSAALAKQAADSAADVEMLERLAAARPEAADSAADLDETSGGPSAGAKAAAGATWDINVASYNSHARVQYYLDFFQETARDRMAIWLTRLPRYEAMIRAKLKERGLPGDMVYLALIESGYSNTAVSRSRAVGMWQFIKGTGRLYGLRIDRWVDERRDPYRATDAAVRYLADLRDRFGSLYLAAAAYNAGAGKVRRGLARLPGEDEDSVNSDASFFRLYDTRLLRRETKDYVPKLIAAALIAKEPERYGFARVDTAGLLWPDSMVAADATGLDVIARLADTTLAAIRELNPQYFRSMTPPRAQSVVRVPAGKGPAVAAAYAELPPSRRITFVEHFVAGGETLGGIAKQYGVTTQTVLDANPGIRPKSLRVGQRLVIPKSGMIPSRQAMLAVEDPAPRSQAPNGMHRVRSGETLSGIAHRYHVSVEQLRLWNALDPQSVLRAGQVLRVAPAKIAEGHGARP